MNHRFKRIQKGMHNVRFRLGYRQLLVYALLGLLITDGVMIHKSNTYHSLAENARTEVAILSRHKKHESYKAKHPVIRKTIPSAYKNMLDDGKTVQNAENKILDISNSRKTKYYQGGGKLATNQTLQKQVNILHQYITSDASTDGDAFSYAWTGHLKDHIKVIPGATSLMGGYRCVFLIINPSTHKIDNAISAIYDNDIHKFESFQVYGSNKYVFSRSNRLKTNKKNKRASKKKFRQPHKAKHVSKRR